jgi:hypothetical protein
MDEAKIESTASKVSPNDLQVSAALVFSSAGAKVKLESDGVEIKGEECRVCCGARKYRRASDPMCISARPSYLQAGFRGSGHSSWKCC